MHWRNNGWIELDGRNYIRVNERLETNVPDVWAIGECAGSPQFTHVSEEFGTIWPAETAAHAIGWSRSACSPIRRSHASD
jgi:pyruvate/2-oxoglutarate dehydrogenase complex dihydrolipoamide dehydrogenase (E3) component